MRAWRWLRIRIKAGPLGARAPSAPGDGSMQVGTQHSTEKPETLHFESAVG